MSVFVAESSQASHKAAQVVDEAMAAHMKHELTSLPFCPVQVWKLQSMEDLKAREF